MEMKDDRPAFYARTRKDWRNWLKKNGQKEKNIWLILYHKTSTVPSVTYREAVEEALCFGWIDSLRKKRDHESSYLTFTPRNPKGTWSKINRGLAERLIEHGQMTEQGQKMIDLAKEKGRWKPEK